MSTTILRITNWGDRSRRFFLRGEKSRVRNYEEVLEVYRLRLYSTTTTKRTAARIRQDSSSVFRLKANLSDLMDGVQKRLVLRNSTQPDGARRAPQYRVSFGRTIFTKLSFFPYCRDLSLKLLFDFCLPASLFVDLSVYVFVCLFVSMFHFLFCS